MASYFTVEICNFPFPKLPFEKYSNYKNNSSDSKNKQYNYAVGFLQLVNL